MTTLADTAIEYARRGWQVFPLKPDKSPATAHGFLDASNDVEIVRSWWTFTPGALIGCRVPPGIIILDLDPRHGGVETIRQLTAQHGSLPKTRIHGSGRQDGGRHIWLRRPPGKLTTKTLPGVDLLHYDLRYTILPPSPHPITGQPYFWAGAGPDDDVADCPGWLAELLQSAEATDPTSTPQLERLPGDSLRSDSPIERFKAEHTIEELLLDAGWQQLGQDRWKHPTAESALSATVRDGRLYNYSTSSGLPVTEHGDPEGMDVFDLYAWLEHDGDINEAVRAIMPERTENGTVPVSPEQMDTTREVVRGWVRRLDDIRNLQPPEAIVEGVLYARTLAAIYGKPGAGKSFLAIDMAAHVASSRRWHGKAVKPGSVLYIAGEGVGGIGKRIRAWEKQSGDIPDDRFAFLDHAPPLLKAVYVEAMLWLVDQMQPDLIVVDTLARSIPGADENAAEAMTSAVAAADRIREACDGTLILVHHTPKAGGSLRGHSSLEGAVDTAIEVSDDGVIRVACEKQKDAEPFDPIFFHKRQIETGEDETSIVLEYARPDSIEVISSDEGRKEAGWLALCRAAGTLPTSRSIMVKTLRERVDVSQSTAYQWLTDWLSDGSVLVYDEKKSLLRLSDRKFSDL